MKKKKFNNKYCKNCGCSISIPIIKSFGIYFICEECYRELIDSLSDDERKIFDIIPNKDCTVENKIKLDILKGEILN